MNVVHVQVTNTGPVFSMERGVVTDAHIRVNRVDYPYDYSVDGVDVFQNFHFAHPHTTTIANSRVLGDQFVLTNVDTKRAVLLLNSWMTKNTELPPMVNPQPSAISISHGSVTKRTKKVKEPEVKEPEEEEEEEEEEEDEDEDEDDDIEDDGEVEKGEDVIID